MWNQLAALFVKDELEQTYTSMFDHATKREEMRALFLEYAVRGSIPFDVATKLGLDWGAPGTLDPSGAEVASASRGAAARPLGARGCGSGIDR